MADVRRLDMWGALEPLTRRQAEERAQALCAEYRLAVQEAILAGSGMAEAHAAARPLQRQAVAVLREAGVSEVRAQGFVALEFHG